MKVNFDGLRKQIARDYNRVVHAFAQREDRTEILERLGDLREGIGSLLCCYSDNPEDEFSDLSDLVDFLAPTESEDA